MDEDFGSITLIGNMFIFHPASVCKGQSWWHHHISSVFNPGWLIACRLDCQSYYLSSKHNIFSTKLRIYGLQDIRVRFACPGSLPGSHRVAISHVTKCLSRYPQTERQSTDCHRCYLSREVAVGRVGFTLCKCEVTVRYCDKIERGQSYSKEFCWQGTGTLIWANFVMWAEPKLPASLCVTIGKLQ